MSYEYMKRLEEQLEAEIEKLLELAAAQDEKEKAEPLVIPEELKRRKERLAKIKQAKEVVEARAAERYNRKKEEYDQKMARRKKQEEKTGKKPKGKTFFNPQEPFHQPDTVIGQMRQRLGSREGASIYSKRKQTVEPVFGIIKEVLGFRRFSLRGEQQTDAE